MPSLYSQFGFGPVASTLMFLGFFFHPVAWRTAIWKQVSSFSFLDSDYKLVVVGSFLLHEVVYVTVNLIMGLIYHFELPFFEQYKVENTPWPWNRSANARADFSKKLTKAVWVTAFNHFCLQLPLLALSYPTFKLCGFDTSLDTLPQSMWVIPLQILVFMLVEDTLFYWAHRWLHEYLYVAIHKQHHEFNTTVGIASEYAHPVEFILSNGFPFTAGPMLVGLAAKAMGGSLHLYVFWMWIVVRIGETVDGHCGYEFSWSPYRLLPFSGSAAHHDFHHSRGNSKTSCNFGSFFTFWDSTMGTDAAFIAHEKQMLAKAKNKAN